MTDSAVCEPPTVKAPAPQPAESKLISEAVAAQVDEKLGHVTNHVLTKAIQLWPRHFRVNVYVKVPAAGERLTSTHEITHSFFIITSAMGKIIGSSPEIEQ